MLNHTANILTRRYAENLLKHTVEMARSQPCLIRQIVQLWFQPCKDFVAYCLACLLNHHRLWITLRCRAAAFWPTALTGPEACFLGLGVSVVEFDVGSPSEARATGRSTVDFRCENAVDEAVYCSVALGDGLPPLSGGESIARSAEAGDFQRGICTGHFEVVPM